LGGKEKLKDEDLSERGGGGGGKEAYAFVLKASGKGRRRKGKKKCSLSPRSRCKRGEKRTIQKKAPRLSAWSTGGEGKKTNFASSGRTSHPVTAKRRKERNLSLHPEKKNAKKNLRALLFAKGKEGGKGKVNADE